MPEALGKRHPRQFAIVTALILVSSFLLVQGLRLPLLYTEQLMFWKSSYSVWTGVVSLWHSGDQLLAAVLFFFSIVFPILKLATLLGLFIAPLREANRLKILHWLGVLGKWSMLDVFVVAILIVLVKLGPVLKMEPRDGVYYFAAAIVCSMVTTMYVNRVIKTRTARPAK